MKTWTIMLAVGVLTLGLAGCNTGPGAPSAVRYQLLGSQSDQGPSVLQAGVPVRGVLLKYTPDGPYSAQAAPKGHDRFQVFCVETESGALDNGKSFNYVLYVPEAIQEQYKAGGGAHPTSGDPFWWYLSTYAGLSLAEVEARWPEVIQALVTRTDLPRARSADVGSGWK